MRIDFSAPIKDMRGEPLVENEKQVTLGSVACNALLFPYQDETNLPGKDKVQRFTLAALCSNETEVDIDSEDVALIKKLIAKMYGPLIVGRAYEIIDPKPKAVAEAG